MAKKAASTKAAPAPIHTVPTEQDIADLQKKERERVAKEAYDRAPGTEKHASVCGDGMNTAAFEQFSADRMSQLERMKKAAEEAQKKAAAEGLKGDAMKKAVNAAKKTAEKYVPSAAERASSLTQWRSAVIDSLKNASAGDVYRGKGKGALTLSQGQANEMHRVSDALAGKTAGTQPWTSTEQLDRLLDGNMPGLSEYGGTGTGYREHKRTMWNLLARRGLAYEGDWQNVTSTSFVNQKGERIYADPMKDEYIVSSKAKGTFALVTYPNGVSRYLRVLEAGTNIGEVSLAGWRSAGYPDVTPRSAPTSKLKVEFLAGSGGLGSSEELAHLNPDEVQRAGKLIREGKLKNVTTRNDLIRAENAERKARGEPEVPLQEEPPPKEKEKAAKDGEKGKAASKGKGSGKSKKTADAGLLLLKGSPEMVGIGPEMRRVGYAYTDCIHQGGGYVVEGTTVYVGKFPMSRVGDATSDGLGIVTGSPDVFIGGPTMTGALA
jgi:hypothetical protein